VHGMARSHDLAGGESANRTLTGKQARFVDEYLLDCNATQAAVRAGYSLRTAHRIGAENMQKPAVLSAIRERQAERAARVQLEAHDLLEELAVIVRSDVRNFQVDDAGELTLRAGVPDKAWRAVSSVKHKIRVERVGEAEVVHRDIEFRLWPKVDAIRTAREHLGLTGAPAVAPVDQAAAIRAALLAMDHRTLGEAD